MNLLDGKCVAFQRYDFQSKVESRYIRHTAKPCLIKMIPFKFLFKMILIADSGSTKTDWMLVEKDGTQTLVNTIGFNPVFDDTPHIVNELSKKLLPKIPASQVEKVYYYGAGCWDMKRKKRVSNALLMLFPKAEAMVQHDLLAAARATCGVEPGIACILGTGSNSCLYDGKDVIDNVTNLGYLIGDEGSGSFLGKMLIRAYFYCELPKELVDEFEETYPGGKSEVLDKVYGGETPNVYLASLTKFLSKHQDHFYIQKLVGEGFAIFIDRHVRKYANHTGLPVHFVGSIAFYFKNILEIILNERSMSLGNIIRKPIDLLVEFHLKY